MQTLVIIGHGSHKNKHSSSAVYKHANRIRELGVFNEVFEAFWKEEPWIRHIPYLAGNQEVFAVPHFMSEGYFVDEVIPRELSTNSESNINYTPPVGTHEAMTDVVVNRAMDALNGEDASKCSLAMIGHGTERNKKSSESIHHQVKRIDARGVFSETKAFFLDEQPGLDEIPGMFNSELVMAIPYLASNGLHTMEDIPQELEISEWRDGFGVSWIDDKEIRYLDAVGNDERTTEVILERAIEAGAKTSIGETDSQAAYIKRSHQDFIDWLIPDMDNTDSIKLGELQVTTDTGGENATHGLRNEKDASKPLEDLREVKPSEAHKIRKQGGSGKYRPLSGAPSLQTGWVMHGLTSQELVSSLEKIYPLAIEFWHRQRTGSLEVTGYREATLALTGMYSEINTLSTQEITSLTTDICRDSCIRERQWSETGTRQNLDPDDNCIPCSEPCSYVVEAARKRQGNSNRTYLDDMDTQASNTPQAGGEAR